MCPLPVPARELAPSAQETEIINIKISLFHLSSALELSLFLLHCFESLLGAHDGQAWQADAEDPAKVSHHVSHRRAVHGAGGRQPAPRGDGQEPGHRRAAPEALALAQG